MISPLLSPETPFRLFSPALADAFAHHSPEDIDSSEALAHGIDHLKGRINVAIEQIKYDSEKTLFSTRNDVDDDEGIENAMDAAYALEFVRSQMLLDHSAALPMQANISPGVGYQLLFS